MRHRTVRSHTVRPRRVATAAAVLVAGSLAVIGTAGVADAATPTASSHSASASAPSTSSATRTGTPTVVLVHGAWADGASFGSIGRRLTDAGYTVVDFADPLRSLDGDAADLDSFLHVRTSGPVILVGHSYGGAVITEAATSDPEVRGLVYVDAFVPDEGESVLGLSASTGSGGIPTSAFQEVPYTGAPAGDADLYLTRAAFDTTFANGLPEREQQELFARQEPVTLRALSEPAATAPAWRTLPSWYVEGTEDRSIPLALQQRMAARAHSHVTTVTAGHLSMLADPAVISRVIEQAATATR